MLRREAAASQFMLDRLISPERLRVFDAMRDNLLISADELTLILASYAQFGSVPDHWRDEVAKLDSAHIAEAVLLRPIAAGCAYLMSVLRNKSEGRIRLEAFILSELSAAARRTLIDEINRADAASLELLSGYLERLDDGASCMAVLNRCSILLLERENGPLPAKIRELLAKAVFELREYGFMADELEQVLFDLRSVLTGPPRAGSLAIRFGVIGGMVFVLADRHREDA